jgi:cobyrinic acid a,c-diamide synthase
MFVIGGVKSGSGKTTITLGLMEALRKRGLKVQPFKAGPDYIDPGLHASVCKVPSYNLDTWMMGEGGVKNTFSSVMAKGADVGVVEGVMGLFDGKFGGKGASVEGSTAHLAKTLSLPVVLVVDVSSMAQSVAALVEGFLSYDKSIKFLGVVFNNVASERHEEIINYTVGKMRGVKILGFIPKDSKLKLPDRHLGLVAREHIADKEWSSFIRRAAKTMEAQLDIDYILKAMPKRKPLKVSSVKATPKKLGTVIAVARDEAFSFCYQENLDILEALGARLAYFSPLKDKKLPKGTQGIYLIGGYPELFARELSGNKKMIKEIKAASKEGKPIFAECGGLMYLGKRIKSLDGKSFEMAGVFPWTVQMKWKRSALGYREVSMLEGAPFIKKGARVRGHEYHYSAITGKIPARIGRCFDVKDSSPEGYMKNKTLATYIHLHFASNPFFARGFVKASALLNSHK